MKTLAEKIYQILPAVPPGRITTYKLLAQATGTRSYRAVGQILRRNPYAPQVPCHRVVASDGTIGGFRGERAGQEIADKIELLKSEGVTVKNGRVQNFQNIIFKFD